VLACVPQPVAPPTRSISALTWRRGPGGVEILMMLRRPEQGLWWSSVTGMLEAGESAEAGAVREVFEETGLRGTLRPLDFAHTFWVDPTLIGLPEGEPRFNRETCFHLEVPSNAEVHLALDEHSEYRWCKVQEAWDLMRWEGSRTALKLLERLLRDPD
jgi:8-oxo-dGTP pyrophosphatase MutT (NUDIX family)